MIKNNSIRFRAELKYAHRGQPLPSSLHIMEKSPQLIGIHTKIRYYNVGIASFKGKFRNVD